MLSGKKVAEYIKAETVELDLKSKNKNAVIMTTSKQYVYKRRNER